MNGLVCRAAAIALVGISMLRSNAHDRLKPDSKADLKTLVEGNNHFAFDLYRKLARHDGNVVFSPYSISIALAMTYAGARGETAEQMARVLHFDVRPDRLHPAFRDLISDVQRKDKSRPYQLYVANSIWGQKDLAFADGFIRLIQHDHRATFRAVDFQRDSEGTRDAINGWIKEQTEKKIQQRMALNSTVSCWHFTK